MPTYDLTVNGNPEHVDVPADMPLLWVLRDVLGLTGTKYSCGIGQCWACAVLVNGSPVFSCQLPVSSAEGKEITTIEGLSGEELHPVQQAWLEKDVPQCGYCQSGQIITAVALLERNPRPSDDEIDAAMSPVICRCGTYNRIREAIHLAAEEMAS
jgi:isoquinoline 1-oxidoreductase alpha subunit